MWFIPLAEPWRNGVNEKFNDHYEQKFLNKVTMTSFDELVVGSLAFENRHSSRYRYSKLGGKTPLMALSNTRAKLYLPPEEKPHVHSLPKPETGGYHVVRFIRSDRKLNMFGERFCSVPNSITNTWWLLVMSKNINLRSSWDMPGSTSSPIHYDESMSTFVKPMAVIDVVALPSFLDFMRLPSRREWLNNIGRIAKSNLALPAALSGSVKTLHILATE